jgi:hypothetical protein
MATKIRRELLAEGQSDQQAPEASLSEHRTLQVALTPFEWGMLDQARGDQSLNEFLTAALRQYLVDHHTALGQQILREGEDRVQEQIAEAYMGYPDEDERMLQAAMKEYTRRRLMEDTENTW